MGYGKIKALGIAPYEGMKSTMMKLANQRDDIDLTVYVGDLKKGVDIVQNNAQNDYNVIISRGGTAEMVGKISKVPVIEIGLSVYDILRAIKLAENYSERYAIVGFPGITGSAHLLCDLLQYKIDIFTIHNENEVQETLRDLKKRGYRMVLCDMIANTIAKKLGLNAILITSGDEGISSAFDQAVKLCSCYADIKEENHLLCDIIRGQNNDTVVIGPDENVCFTTLGPDRDELILGELKKELSMALESESHKTFKNINGVLYAVTTRRIESKGGVFAVFYITAAKVPMTSSKYGIKYSSRKDVEDRFFNSFFSVIKTITDTGKNLEQITQSSCPVMLTGETGTGKEQVAGAIYSQSPFSHNPLITIDCSLVNEKSWNFITSHYNSPFNDNNNTIFFKEISQLPEQYQKQLLSITIDMNLCKRNRIIFSCSYRPGETLPEPGIKFINTLSCITVQMPSLRERTSDFPTLSSLYLNELNVNMAKQIIGLEPAAMELMQNYDWPYNYTQFKRVLSELALVTSVPYIQSKDVEDLLKKERMHGSGKTILAHCEKSLATLPDTSRTLDEINKDIIQMVLNETNGNQSAAAKRLGISRTTLWRYLK